MTSTTVFRSSLNDVQHRAIQRGACPCGVPLGDGFKSAGVHPGCAEFLYKPKHVVGVIV